jgi:predicted permease
MQELLTLQLNMFILILAGLILKKIGMIGNEGQRNLTDLVIYLVLPCNIIKSFMIDFSVKILYSFAGILVISLLIQIGCTLLGKVLYNWTDPEQKKCLQYGTICSNAGFLGNPIAEGVFGSMGLALASIYLIPQRIVMWSGGIAVFTESPDKKSMVKKVLTHPCIIACEIGILLMLTQYQLPGFLTASVQTISNCNTALSMMVIGMILADVSIKTMIDRKVLFYSIIRLLLIPILVYIPCRLLHIDSVVMGTSVLLAAMPAGATTSILASKYNGDAVFATKLVVFSTMASLLTTPVWSYFLLK